MADISDVIQALATIASGVLYPAGIPGGTNPPSPVAGIPVICYPGWPHAPTLDKDLAAGKAHVSVFPLPGERNTNRGQQDWQTVSTVADTLAAVVAGQTITITGTVATPQNVVAIINKTPYVYAVLVSDSLSSIAAGLAALIAADFPGTAAVGAVITVPSAGRIAGTRIGSSGTSMRITRLQERMVQITIWTNTPQNRDAVAQPLDQAFSDIERFVLPDQTFARLTYAGSPMSDTAQRDDLYRRDLQFSIEYATSVTQTDTEITQETINVAAKKDGATTTQPVVTISL